MTVSDQPPFDTVESAIADIAAGKLIIVTDDENRENEGDLVIPAQMATPEAINFMATHARGLVSLALTEARRVLRPGGKLLIADMTPHDREEYRRSMGHLWQGFGREQLTGWLDDAGFTATRYQQLSADPAAKGPALFTASATVPKRAR